MKPLFLQPGWVCLSAALLLGTVPAFAQDADPVQKAAPTHDFAARMRHATRRDDILRSRFSPLRLAQTMPGMGGMNHEGHDMGSMDGMAVPSATPTSPAPSAPSATATSTPPAAPGASGATRGSSDVRTLDNLSPEQEFAPPVADRQEFSLLLFERLEYGAGNLHWDILGWRGGDIKRTWFKSEGDQPTRGGGFEGDVQLLRGKLITPNFDFQYGLRFEGQRSGGSSRGRVFAVVGLQGLAPYRYEIEPALFVDQSGNVSGRFTATYDLLFSQRLILQPRFETNFAMQEVERFGVGRGLNDAEVALLLRYEIRRDFAPYIGLTYGRSFGGSARFLREEGEDIGGFKAVAGVRMWF